ncbi:uncharacterized protein LOC129802105 [Phlebotomus papatasi]|uniref:uncharacterized protein LOC129802105 n=1 Tax=Phlebotomus papatasi TaxID=29031 RepID=UPI0024846FB9|nr:uncharacterized protein LOC129802105 [Phlebotomus papatasi]
MSSGGKTQCIIYGVNNVVEKAIEQMKNNELLWNTRHPNFFKVERKKLLEKCAKQIGIPDARLAEVISYIKKKYILEDRKKKEAEKNGIGSDDYKNWKWYDRCAFLRNWNHNKSSRINPKFTISWDNSTARPPDSSEATSTALKSYSRTRKSLLKTEYNSPEVKFSDPSGSLVSTSEVLIADQNPEFHCKLEDETEDLSQERNKEVDISETDPQKDNTIDTPTDTASEGEPEDPIATRSPPDQSSSTFSEEKRKFLIDAVRSSIAFQLSNEELSEHDLVAFHSDIIMYMHSYFNDKTK